MCCAVVVFLAVQGYKSVVMLSASVASAVDPVRYNQFVAAAPGLLCPGQYRSLAHTYSACLQTVLDVQRPTERLEVGVVEAKVKEV